MELYFLALLIIFMAGALAMGFPVAFALPGAAILSIAAAAFCGWIFAGDLDAFFAQGGPITWLNAGVTNFRGVYWEVERDTLIAIPLFVFMGIMLQRSKIAEDLLLTMAQLFGPVPGGLGISVVFVGALLAASTGILGATVVAMGLISLPVMLRNGYSPALASGTIAASGTLGQIIPPSIVLIILADQLSSAVDQASAARKILHKTTTGELSMPSELDLVSASAGDMFMGAFIPGLVLVGLYMAFILVVAIIRPKLAPAVPSSQGYDRAFFLRVLLILVPPLVLIFMVLGSIILGVATVNQAGAIGAIGATIMAGSRLREGQKNAYYPAILAILSVGALAVIVLVYQPNAKAIYSSDDVVGIVLAAMATFFFVIAVLWSLWRTFKIQDTLRGVMEETAKTTSLVFIILIGAAMLTAAFRAFGGEEVVREFLGGLPGGFWTQFVIVMGVIFLLGFFLDFIEIAVVVVPVVAPILLADPGANVTAVWLGVMIGLNIQTSFLTPPFGFALFYLRGVAPAIVKTVQIYKGVIAFILLQLVGLAIVGYTPSLVNYLPSRISLTAPTAPPPVNPKLQYCIQEHVFEQYRTHEKKLLSSINGARQLDIGYLPKKWNKDINASLDSAASIFTLYRNAEAAENEILENTPTYKPLHIQVRRLQARKRKIDAKIENLSDDLDRLVRQKGEQSLIDKATMEISELKKQLAELEAAIPENWMADRKAFVAWQKAERTALLKYRRTADNSYQTIQELIAVLEHNNSLVQVEPEFAKLTTIANSQTPDILQAAISTLVSQLRSAKSGSAVTGELSKAKRLVRKNKVEWNKVHAHLNMAATEYVEEVAWRRRAGSDLLGGLKSYEEDIRSTIGLRQQRRLPKDIALSVAACNSGHRDLSLYF